MSKIAEGQAELFALETEVSADSELAEIEPTFDDMSEAAELEAALGMGESFPVIDSHTRLEDVVSGYSVDEWIDVMLSTDTHKVGMSRGVAIERLRIEQRATRQARLEAANVARDARRAELAATAEKLAAQRKTATYAAMSALLAELRSRGVVMTLAAKTVTVAAVSWVKGEGDTLSDVATFTFARGVYRVKIDGRVTPLNFEQMVTLLTELLPERSADLMPRKFRDVMRTHRHKNSTPGDPTGNRATFSTDITDVDLETYPKLAVEGPARKTSGRMSRQGERGMTADERRASDRERLRVWRERKRAEKLAASFVEPVSA